VARFYDMDEHHMNSNDKHKDALRTLQLQFVGKLLAGFTHETKNYLAIIKESVGLIGDMLKMGKLSRNDVPEYFNIINSINEQIEKANDLFKYLNRFAHRMDTPLSAFNVNESLEELSGLLNRFANQKRIVLEKQFQKDLPQIYSNPSLLQLLVFNIIESGMPRLDRNSTISIQTHHTDGFIDIRIILKGTVLEEGASSHELNDSIIKELGGQLSLMGGTETFIHLPVRNM